MEKNATNPGKILRKTTVDWIIRHATNTISFIDKDRFTGENRRKISEIINLLYKVVDLAREIEEE